MKRIAVFTLVLTPLVGACAPDNQIEVQPVEEIRVPAPVMPDDTMVIDTVMPPDTIPADTPGEDR